MTDALIKTLQQRIASQYDGSKLLFSAHIEVERHLSQKNRKDIFLNKRTGVRFIGQEPKSRQAKDSLVRELRREASKAHFSQPIGSPVWAVFLFTFMDFFTKKGNIRKTLPDLSNLYQGPEDALQKAGILENDSLIHSHDLSRRIPGDKNSITIFIMSLGDTPWTPLPLQS